MTRDAFDRLRDADPLHGRPAPDADSPQARAMRDAIMAGQATSLQAARRRRRRMIAGAVAVAAAAATAAALAVSTSPVSDPTSIGCYAAPTTDADTIGLVATGASPVEQCRQLWEAGELDPAVTSPEQVPPLVACVLDPEGIVGVFPASSCDDVRDPGPSDVGDPLPTPPAPTATTAPTTSPEDDSTTGLSLPDYQTDDRTVIQAMEEIRLALLEDCLTIDAATRLVRDVLADHELDGWTVEPVLEGPYDEHCAGFFPQAADEAVWLVPDPPAEGQTSE